MIHRNIFISILYLIKELLSTGDITKLSSYYAVDLRNKKYLTNKTQNTINQINKILFIFIQNQITQMYCVV